MTDPTAEETHEAERFSDRGAAEQRERSTGGVWEGKFLKKYCLNALQRRGNAWPSRRALSAGPRV
jgi:hypothetical protein